MPTGNNTGTTARRSRREFRLPKCQQANRQGRQIAKDPGKLKWCASNTSRMAVTRTACCVLVAVLLVLTLASLPNVGNANDSSSSTAEQARAILGPEVSAKLAAGRDT